ncbi:MAG: HEAT repeat domain-containing protein [Acidobacteria bacterium]|nr:HEAT repeat domain-containing protein [Acidobacteriota bacterium]MYJ06076.1 HEAT repeat domain-containing protein [Acidobacteriota bacterium]
MSSRYEALVASLDGNDFYPPAMELAGGGAEAIPAVHAGMSHSNWRIRRGCAWALGQLADAESLRRLTLLTRDPKKKVRKMAILSLGLAARQGNGSGRGIDSVPQFAYSAVHDPSVRVRRVAVLMLLLQAPERRVARILRKVMATEQDPKVVRLAEWALQQRGKRA